MSAACYPEHAAAFPTRPQSVPYGLFPPAYPGYGGTAAAHRRLRLPWTAALGR